jgi:hypothetical protein
VKGGAKWATGKFGGALRFDGKDDYVSVPDAADLRVAGDITVAFWMCQRAAAKDYVRVVGKGDKKYRNYGLWLPRGGGGPMLFQQYGGSGRSVLEIKSKTAIETSQWYHIAGVVSGSRAHVYVNGRLDASGSRSGGAGTSSAPLTMGCAGYHGYFPGLLDDVRVYKRALSAEEIKALFEGRAAGAVARPPGPTRGLTGHWMLDEGKGSLARDSSGKGKGGRISGATWAAGRLGGALEFDGSNDKVDVAYSPALNPARFSLALWAKPTGGAGKYRSPLTSRDDRPQRGYMLYAHANDTWSFWIGTGSGFVGIDGPPVVLGTWTHVASTYDGTTMRMYVNGTDIGRTRAAKLSLNKARPLRIGAGSTEGKGNYFFPGLVDDVRIYDRALGAQEVKELVGLRN